MAQSIALEGQGQPARQGVVALIGRVLDRYGEHTVLLLIVASIANVPAAVVGALAADAGLLGQFLGVLVAYLATLASAAALIIAYEAIEAGAPTSLKSVFDGGIEALPRWIGLGIVVGLLFLVLAFAASFLAPIVAWAALVGLVLSGLVLGAIALFAVPALVIEELGPIEAIRRSIGLLRRTWRSSLPVLTLAGLVAIAGPAWSMFVEVAWGSSIASAVGAALMTAVLEPFLWGLMALQFLEVRRDATGAVTSPVHGSRARRTLLAIAIAIVLAVGIGGAAVSGSGLVSLFAEPQGVVQFGTSPPTTECEIQDPVTSVATDTDVHWAAVLKRSLGIGEAATVDLLLDRVRHDSVGHIADEVTPCLMTIEPWQFTLPGEYTVRVLVGEEVLAEGSLIVE